MIDTIVFDIGNVLALTKWRETFINCNIPADLYEQVAVATIYSDLWPKYDAGLISVADMITGCTQYAPQYEEYIRNFFNSQHLIAKETDYAVNWIKYYRDNGFKTYILSNFPKEAFEACEDNFNFLKYVDGALVSYRVNLLKPDRKIYDKLCVMYDIIPEHAVFVDDMKENVHAAIDCGFNGVIFNNKTQADCDIKAICYNNKTSLL